MKVFRCSDIYLAAYLRCEGFSLLAYEMSQENSRIYYTFEDSEELRGIVLRYRGDDASTHPRELRDSVRDIKTMVSTGRKVGEGV